MTEDVSFSPSCIHLTALVILNDVFAASLARCSDLTTTQYRILLDAYESNGNNHVGAIAKSLLLNSNAVSSATVGLVERDYIVQAKSSADKRLTTLSVTDRGLKHIRIVDASLYEDLIVAFGTLGNGSTKTIFGVIDTLGLLAEGKLDNAVSSNISSAYLTTVAGVQSAFTKCIKGASGLSYTGFRVLERINVHRDGVRVTDVADELLLPTNTITWICNNLLEDGFISKESLDGDLRAVMLVATDEGRAVYQKAQDSLDEFIAPIFKQMSTDQIEWTFEGSRRLIETARKEGALLG